MVSSTALSAADILGSAAEWLDSGKKVALATVVSTWGSSPRPVGSQLAVSEDMAFVGSVSGGCIEGAVIEEALQVMANGEPRLLAFGVSNEMAWEVGLACGGRVEVFVERAPRDLLQRLLAGIAAQRPLALCTRIDGASQHLIYYHTENHHDDAVVVGAELLAAARQALLHDQSQVVEIAEQRWFITVFNPPLRLLVVGAVHITQALVPAARLAGFEVTVIDPRQAWASADRFAGVSINDAWPDEALTALEPNRRTALVTLSHDPKLDDPALTVALRSPVFYIGALGSRRTHAARLQRLRELGFGDELERIHAPIGLDIGAKTPAEIAIAIVAEIIQALHGN